jgi:hypothetical protein
MYKTARVVARAGVTLLTAAVLAGCDIAVTGDGGFHFDVAAGKAQDEWTRTYEVAAGGRLEIINVNGRVTAEASDGAAVEIRAERIAKAATDESARSLLERIEMREEVSDARVRVEVRPPRFNGPSGHEVRWTIRVPRTLAVDLRTVNGGVHLVGLEGSIRARTTNGGIVGRAIGAAVVDAAVTNGGVAIELARPVNAGTYELEAVNGGVSLTLPGESKADIAARCLNGGISVAGLDLDVQEGDRTRGGRASGSLTFRRRLSGQLNGGGARVSMEAVNGGVRITRSGAST